MRITSKGQVSKIAIVPPSLTAAEVSAALPFVLPTGAKRCGGTCGSIHPTLSPNLSNHPKLCHPDPDFLYVAPSTTACAAFGRESRIRFANANKLHRKSGGAQPRDLQFSLPTTLLEVIFRRSAAEETAVPT